MYSSWANNYYDSCNICDNGAKTALTAMIIKFKGH